MGKFVGDKKRAKLTGRGLDGKFFMLKDSISRTEQFGLLSGNATKLLVELARQYNGMNNGDMSIPWSRLKHRGWHSKGTIDRAKVELLAGGWIVETRKGGKNHVCSLYAVTWWPVDECNGKHMYPVENVASNLWNKIKSSTPYGTCSGPSAGQLARKAVNY